MIWFGLCAYWVFDRDSRGCQRVYRSIFVLPLLLVYLEVMYVQFRKAKDCDPHLRHLAILRMLCWRRVEGFSGIRGPLCLFHDCLLGISSGALYGLSLVTQIRMPFFHVSVASWSSFFVTLILLVSKDCSHPTWVVTTQKRKTNVNYFHVEQPFACYNSCSY